MPHWPEFLVGCTYSPVSYRADVEQTINLYPERVESEGGTNTGFLRRRPALMSFAGQTAGGTTTGSISYAMVGAGGWYGAGISVGGGGGGSVKQGTLSMTVGTYPSVIGRAAAASAGGDSTFNGATALGGGVGGDDLNPGTGGNGGNGGGAATSYYDGVSTWTPFSGGVGSDGFNGGNSAINSGAGGGGAGSAGANATQNNGGAGGDGVTVTIPGGSLVLGPGGAGVGLTTRGAFTTGDYGSGGSQEDYTGPDPAVDPQDGVVVVWYQTGDFTATGGTITTSGDYTIHTFTADDDFIITAVVPTVITAASGGAIHYCPAQGRCFVVSNSGAFQEVFADGSLQTFGAVTVGPYRPTMADNGTGDQLLVVSGYQAWIFDLSTNALTRVTDGDLIENVVLCAFSDGYFLVLNTRGALQWSAPLDGTAWDALDIAKNSATSDPWVSLLVNHRELWLVGTATGQVWVNTGNADQPFELVQGSVFHQGLIAPFTLQRCDNSSFWVGQNEQGRCIVFRASGYTPTRISTHAIEVALGRYTQLENAIASVFQSEGHTCYAIYVPDVDLTYVYDASTEKWSSWGQLVSDASDPWTWAPWPVQGSTFAFGKNLVVGPSTVLIAWLRWGL